MIARVAAALAACVLAASPAAADTLVNNINGVSVSRDGTVTQFGGMMIRDDGIIRQILKRGEQPMTPYQYHVDGQGKTVVPGMIDAHLHLMDLGFQALTLDLSETTSLADAQAKIAAYAARFPNRAWIIGTGWNQEKWGLGRFPTAAELDAAVADRPVWLSRVDGHAGWANSKALQMAGITAKTADPDGGRILRTGATRNPAGVLVDNAQKLVDSKVPKPRPEDRDLAFLTAQDMLIRQGVTAVADMGISIDDWQSYRRAGDSGQLRIRIMAYAGSVEDMALIGGPGPTPWLYDDRLRLNGIKLFLDGALGSRGAWLKAPYTDDPGNSGLQLLNPTQLRNIMSRAALDKFQVAIHAIGDAANAEALSAISEMADTYKGDRRWRIEHAQVVDPADFARFAEEGAIASMQPTHQTSDRLMAEARLGPDRLAGAYAWRSMLDAKVPLAFGSDAPVELPRPFEGMAVAITREDKDGQPFGGWQPQQVISREQALAAYTAGAAYAGFADGHFGQLTEGERADFLVVDQDPFLASTQDLRNTKVLQVWINGAQVFDAATAVPLEIKQDEAMKSFDLGETTEATPPAEGR
ncbi:amidohydrolase [Erythrobacter sp. SG61-1L]|uniref:amidohydrolase n=1 Tax=Erythrobacter sp. SG61-1L TaxID=1603897 RepID=UPI0009EADBB3|nr:amidohydrolase [Erythrobacter sp. SG61-1L]